MVEAWENFNLPLFTSSCCLWGAMPWWLGDVGKTFPSLFSLFSASLSIDISSRIKQRKLAISAVFSPFCFVSCIFLSVVEQLKWFDINISFMSVAVVPKDKRIDMENQHFAAQQQYCTLWHCHHHTQGRENLASGKEGRRWVYLHL